MLKTGLIQPETIPGHFPRNLRTIVELYRSCVDGGAELVLCPPLALSGAHTGELALRSGFRSQHKAALAYIASGQIPVRDLITRHVPLEEALDALDIVARGEAIKVTVEP